MDSYHAKFLTAHGIAGTQSERAKGPRNPNCMRETVKNHFTRPIPGSPGAVRVVWKPFRGVGV